MNSYLIVVLSVSCCIYFSAAASLPDFITPCKGTDPNLNECALKEANKIIPTLVKGYPKLNIPVLEPLNIPEVQIQSNGQLHIILKNSNIYGLSRAELKSINFDLKGQKISLQLLIPNLNVQGDYEVNGSILVLPITGNGPANITAEGGVYDISFSYNLYEKKGVQYAKMENVEVALEVSHLSISLENLFNGNKELSDNANRALNAEWKQVLKELEPALKEAIGLVVLQVVNGVTDKVPFADIFDGELP